MRLIHDTKVYEKARDLLNGMIEDGSFVTEDMESYYVYELVMEGRSQTGLVACASLDDYLNNVIKKHEKTREDKEIDRIRHVDICNAQTGPIFLRSHKTINDVIEDKEEAPLCNFICRWYRSSCGEYLMKTCEV